MEGSGKQMHRDMRSAMQTCVLYLFKKNPQLGHFKLLVFEGFLGVVSLKVQDVEATPLTPKPESARVSSGFASSLLRNTL